MNIINKPHKPNSLKLKPYKYLCCNWFHFYETTAKTSRNNYLVNNKVYISTKKPTSHGQI